MAMWLRRMRESKGASMVEYALLAALIGVALIVTVTALRGGIKHTFDEIKTKLTTTQQG